MVYQELRRLAHRRMGGERCDQTLQATALVHEAYLRLLVGDPEQRWDDQWHFFAAAAQSMRRILVERARARGRLKRGAGLARVDLDDAALAAEPPPEHVLALDEALGELSQRHPEKARLVELRYFAGLTIPEAAQALGVSTATAERDWRYARAWLFRRVAGPSRDTASPILPPREID